MSAMTASGPVRVVIVDDHDPVRVGLVRVLARSAGLHPVAALSDAAALGALLEHETVDAVVLDVDPERGDGLAACSRTKRGPSPPAVVLYSAYAGPGLALAAAVAGADALVGKAEPVEVLLEALRRCAAGERLLDDPAVLARSLGVEPHEAAVRARAGWGPGPMARA